MLTEGGVRCPAERSISTTPYEILPGTDPPGQVSVA